MERSRWHEAPAQAPYAHPAQHIGVDETAFRNGHDYPMIVSEGVSVLHVADDRKQTSPEGYYASLSDTEHAAIQSVSMNVWSAHINSTLAALLDARGKIAFDKFHVAKYLGNAVDKVRAQSTKRCAHRVALIWCEASMPGCATQAT